VASSLLAALALDVLRQSYRRAHAARVWIRAEDDQQQRADRRQEDAEPWIPFIVLETAEQEAERHQHAAGDHARDAHDRCVAESPGASAQRT
jgi:hypothetical protein